VDRFADVLIVGAGAAGLATAIFAARRCPERRIVLLDGAKKPGAKILVSGGGRCNVTNVRVTPDDFFGGSRNSIRNVLRAFTEKQTADFFHEIGVPMHEEQWGKLFPDSNSARTVLEALLAEASRLGVKLLPDRRVVGVAKCTSTGFVVDVVSSDPVSTGPFPCGTLVLATGGKSLPKTGSDGSGYELARSLGHSIVPLSPALAPLVLDGEFHTPLSGISHEVEVVVRVGSDKPLRICGPMLWTHFGLSGPAILDASRHWHRARLENRAVTMALDFFPGEEFASVEARILDLATKQPNTLIRNALTFLLPTRLVEGVLTTLGLFPQLTMGRLTRDDRRRLVTTLLEFPLKIRDSRGYTYAEATAGGVHLTEIDPATMGSRVCPGLYLVGEILDVDGRIGGFNFQWAWSSGYVAGIGIERAIAASG
jgi:predicted Rossmann fold flavoprotein